MKRYFASCAHTSENCVFGGIAFAPKSKEICLVFADTKIFGAGWLLLVTQGGASATKHDGSHVAIILVIVIVICCKQNHPLPRRLLTKHDRSVNTTQVTAKRMKPSH